MRARIALLKHFRAKTIREMSFLFREARPRLAFPVVATGLWRQPPALELFRSAGCIGFVFAGDMPAAIRGSSLTCAPTNRYCLLAHSS